MREGMEGDPLFRNKYPNPGGRKVDLVACTAKKRAERIGLVLAENKLRSWSVLDCKCPAHPYAVTQKTLRTVDIRHLVAADEWRTSLQIVFIDPHVHLSVD
jgi:hypothetical protein